MSGHAKYIADICKILGLNLARITMEQEISQREKGRGDEEEQKGSDEEAMEKDFVDFARREKEEKEFARREKEEREELLARELYKTVEALRKSVKILEDENLSLTKQRDFLKLEIRNIRQAWKDFSYKISKPN